MGSEPVLRSDAPAPSAVAWICRATSPRGDPPASPRARGGIAARDGAGDEDATARAVEWVREKAMAALALCAPFDGVRIVAELSPRGSRENHTVEYSTRARAASVRARDRAHVAHSFYGAIFGAAQQLHGITFTVDATASCVDASRLPSAAALRAALRAAISEYDMRNLDEHADFGAARGADGGAEGEASQSTCEAFGRALWARLSAAPPFGAAAMSGRSGSSHGGSVAPPLELALRVHESDVASVDLSLKHI
mgnify:FL=1